MALRTKGIGTENIKLSIEKLKEDKPDPDFNSAMKICKKRIGPLRPEANREIYYKKTWVFWQDQVLVMIFQKNTIYDSKGI